MTASGMPRAIPITGARLSLVFEFALAIPVAAVALAVGVAVIYAVAIGVNELDGMAVKNVEFEKDVG